MFKSRPTFSVQVPLQCSNQVLHFQFKFKSLFTCTRYVLHFQCNFSLRTRVASTNEKFLSTPDPGTIGEKLPDPELDPLYMSFYMHSAHVAVHQIKRHRMILTFRWKFPLPIIISTFIAPRTVIEEDVGCWNRLGYVLFAFKQISYIAIIAGFRSCLRTHIVHRWMNQI